MALHFSKNQFNTVKVFDDTRGSTIELSLALFPWVQIVKDIGSSRMALRNPDFYYEFVSTAVSKVGSLPLSSPTIDEVFTALQNEIFGNRILVSSIDNGGSPTGPVLTVAGTSGRITIGGPSSHPTVDIASTYAGQASITTLGTIATGIWQGTAIADLYIASAATWNAKQNQLNGTGFVKVTGTTVSYDNSTYLQATGLGSTDNAIVRVNGTGGNAIQTSGVILDDSSNILPSVSGTGSLGSSSFKWASLYLAAGTTTVAPILFTSGTLLTTPVNGTVEFDGTHLYVTIGGVRYAMDNASAAIVIDSTAITSGTAGRILFESATNKVSEHFNLHYDPATSTFSAYQAVFSAGLMVVSAASVQLNSGFALQLYSGGFIQGYQQPTSILRSYPSAGGDFGLIVDNDVTGGAPDSGYKILSLKLTGTEVAYVNKTGSAFFTENVTVNGVATNIVLYNTSTGVADNSILFKSDYATLAGGGHDTYQIVQTYNTTAAYVYHKVLDLTGTMTNLLKLDGYGKAVAFYNGSYIDANGFIMDLTSYTGYFFGSTSSGIGYDHSGSQVAVSALAGDVVVVSQGKRIVMTSDRLASVAALTISATDKIGIKNGSPAFLLDIIDNATGITVQNHATINVAKSNVINTTAVGTHAWNYAVSAVNGSTSTGPFNLRNVGLYAEATNGTQNYAIAVNGHIIPVSGGFSLGDSTFNFESVYLNGAPASIFMGGSIFSRSSIYSYGNFSFNVGLLLPAGTTTGMPPLKFTSGTNLTTPDAGAMEWDGSRLYITQTSGPTRKTIAYTTDTAASITIDSTNIISGTAGRILFESSSNKVTESASLLWDDSLKSLGINVSPASGIRLYLKGDGVTSSTIPFLVRNSSLENLLYVNDNGDGNIGRSELLSVLNINARMFVGGLTTPTALLHIGAGTTTIAPVKFVSGTNLSSAVAGAMEWDGSRLYITQTSGPTRQTISYLTDTATSITIGVTTIASGTSQAVLFQSTAGSTVSQNGGFLFDATSGYLTIPSYLRVGNSIAVNEAVSASYEFVGTSNTADTSGIRLTNTNALATISSIKTGLIAVAGQTGYSLTDWPNSFILESSVDGGMLLSAYGVGSGGIKFQTGVRVTRMKITDAGVITAFGNVTLATGTTTLAPLKFVSGTNLASAVAGAMEWDGTHLYITQTSGPTRQTILYSTDVVGVYLPLSLGANTTVNLNAHTLKFQATTSTIGFQLQTESNNYINLFGSSSENLMESINLARTDGTPMKFRAQQYIFQYFASSLTTDLITLTSNTANFTGQINMTGSGSMVFGDLLVPVGAGPGIESHIAAGTAYHTAYNRTGSAWVPMVIRGGALTIQANDANSITVQTNGKRRMFIASNGAITFGDSYANGTFSQIEFQFDGNTTYGSRGLKLSDVYNGGSVVLQLINSATAYITDPSGTAMYYSGAGMANPSDGKLMTMASGRWTWDDQILYVTKSAGLSDGIVIKTSGGPNTDPYSPILSFQNNYNNRADIWLGYLGDLLLSAPFTKMIKFGLDQTFYTVSINSYYYDSSTTGYAMLVRTGDAPSIPLVVRGASSQTANLQQWQDSSAAVLASVSAAGNITAIEYRVADMNTAPANSSDTGTKGEIRWTATAVYLCTATNTWVKATLATF